MEQALTLTSGHQAIAENIPLSDAVEQALAVGDLAKLSPEHRVQYYHAVCLSVGLNPLTRPFGFFKDENGVTTMYARKECAEQLRKKHRVSVKETGRDWIEENMLAISVTASTPDGREEDEMGVVYLAGKDGRPWTGQHRANMIMKCLTKAKRRATLALIGLGFAQADDVPEGQVFDVDMQTGALPEESVPALPQHVETQTETNIVDLFAETQERTPDLHLTRDERQELIRSITSAERHHGISEEMRYPWLRKEFGVSALMDMPDVASLKLVLDHVLTLQADAYQVDDDEAPVSDEPVQGTLVDTSAAEQRTEKPW